MSELKDNARKRKDLLKHMIQQLHKGEAPEQIKAQLTRMMGEVPYGDVMEVEQELINEGTPVNEVLNLCDIHTAALRDKISHAGAKTAPAGHPVHTFKEENRALQWEVDQLNKLYDELGGAPDAAELSKMIDQIRARIIALTDVEKHYQRKEHLLFPFLEKHNITGPPKVMWGKHDETRALLKKAVEALREKKQLNSQDAKTLADTTLKPASDSVAEMIYKEENILFPMTLDTLTDAEWHNVYDGSVEIGFCLYDPTDKWQPAEAVAAPAERVEEDKIQLPSGSVTASELNSILNTIPFDLTFVDKDDKVRYFTQGRERIFARTRAILGRDVQLCHPPASVHIVQKIVDDFKAGRANRAPFWITLNGQFIHIEYFALRDENGEYQGVLEVSQNLTEKRALDGEQRLLNYVED
ncbi:MAG: DUF438 domain-containing protein [Candidatus Latescibacterota bacterium]|nr:MAG: DUF438 domain-containing protein [Candidatus Latescibacterota bacterium]